MDGNFVGLVAVMMIFGIALAAMYIYTFFHMRKLCREERLAAITRGDVPMQAELSEAARSPRSGILLVAGAIGYFVPYLNAARGARGHDRGHVGPDGLTVGIGFFCRSRSHPAGWENIVKGKGRTERKLTENGRPRTRGESMLAQNWHRTRDVQYSFDFSIFRQFIRRKVCFRSTDLHLGLYPYNDFPPSVSKFHPWVDA